MKRLFVLTATSLVFSLGSPLISLSAIPTNCDQQEEVFGFQIPTYATEHEGAPIINIQVTYRYRTHLVSLLKRLTGKNYRHFGKFSLIHTEQRFWQRYQMDSICQRQSPRMIILTLFLLKKISKHLSLIILITQIFGKSSIKN